MIRIHITDEQGTLLGNVELDLTDLTPGTDNLNASWVGQQVIEQLPTDKPSLLRLLVTDNPPKGI